MKPEPETADRPSEAESPQAAAPKPKTPAKGGGGVKKAGKVGAKKAKPSKARLLVWLVPLAMTAAGYYYGDRYVKAKAAALAAKAAEEPPPEHSNLSIDDAIENEEYANTLKRIKLAIPKVAASERFKWLFREAVCLELMAKYEDAADRYGKYLEAVSNMTVNAAHGHGNVPATLPARLGQARCWACLGRVMDARLVLSRLTLYPAEWANESAFADEVMQIRAWVEAALMPERPKPSPLHRDGFALATKRLDISTYFKAVGAIQEPQEHDSHGSTSGHGHDAHGGTAKHDDHGKADPHGKPGTPKQGGHDDHGKADPHGKPVAPMQGGHDEHGKADPHGKPAAPKQEGHDDHGKADPHGKPAAPKQGGHDDHGKADPHGKPAAPKQAGHDDHGKADPHGKPAAPKQGRHDDHGKADPHGKPAAPKQEGHDDHGKADPHGKPPAAPTEHGPLPRQVAPLNGPATPPAGRLLESIPIADHPVDAHPAVAPKPKSGHDSKKPPVETDQHGEKHPEASPHSEKKEPHQAESIKPEPLTVRTARIVGQSLVSGAPGSAVVRETLRELVEKTGRKFVIDSPALERLDGRSIPMNVVRMTLEDCYDALCEPYGVAWSADEQSIQFVIDKDDSAVRIARNRRRLNKALLAAPEHPWSRASKVELGVLDAMEGKFKDAAVWFQRVVSEAPLKPEALPASYNLGLVSLAAGERTRAREYLLGVADRDPGGRWAGLSYYWAGRTLLDGNEPAKAVPLFQRSAKAAPGSTVGAAANLAECACYYLRGEYGQGHDLLKEHKKQLARAGFRETLILFDAYGRYRTARNPKHSGEFEELVDAVLQTKAGSAVGPAGGAIFAEAARETHLNSRAVEFLMHAVADLRGPMAGRLLTELGGALTNEGEGDRALNAYRAASAVDDGFWGAKARAAVAEILLKSGKTDEALKIARELAGIDSPNGLRLMGRAYESLNDPRRAAECFAGRMPE